MTLENRRNINFDDAKTGMSSLVKQTALVGASFLIMLLLTGGNPSTFVVSLSVCLGIIFVAWSEKNRFTILTNLRDTNLRGANLSSADLRGVDLFGADLRGANLFGVDLRGADLRGADLRGADLFGADLFGADLFATNLSGANLSGANLSSANLSGANLSGAVVTKTLFTDSIGFTEDMKCELERRGAIFSDRPPVLKLN